MRHFLINLLLLTIIGTVSSLTCEGMDDKNPIIQGASRAACVASCNIQNCPTGYCVKDTIKEKGKKVTRKTCKCSRCDKGSILSLDPLSLISKVIPKVPSKKGKSEKGKKTKKSKKA